MISKSPAGALRNRIFKGRYGPSKLASDTMICNDPSTADRLHFVGSSAIQVQPYASCPTKSSRKFAPDDISAVGTEVGAIVEVGSGIGEFVGRAVSIAVFVIAGVGEGVEFNIYIPATAAIATSAITPHPANAQMGKRFGLGFLDATTFDASFV